jgi:hypothetical protein
MIVLSLSYGWCAAPFDWLLQFSLIILTFDTQVIWFNIASTNDLLGIAVKVISSKTLKDRVA